MIEMIIIFKSDVVRNQRPTIKISLHRFRLPQIDDIRTHSNDNIAADIKPVFSIAMQPIYRILHVNSADILRAWHHH
jgi:hypothetical protein